MNKIDNIFQLSKEKTKQIVSSGEDWKKFLKSSAYMYKYPFEDQVLIYALRPDAKACATMEFWNRRMYRWINRGAKGIPLLDYSSGNIKLKYVFDISDTHETLDAKKDVNLFKFDKNEWLKYYPTYETKQVGQVLITDMFDKESINIYKLVYLALLYDIMVNKVRETIRIYNIIL